MEEITQKNISKVCQNFDELKLLFFFYKNKKVWKHRTALRSELLVKERLPCETGGWGGQRWGKSDHKCVRSQRGLEQGVPSPGSPQTAHR